MLLMERLLLRFAGSTAARAWLLAGSLFFYAWWDVRFLPILLGSMVVNYAFGGGIQRTKRRSPRGGKALLAAGIAANLLTLGYYKYTGFFLETYAALTHAQLTIPSIVLPIGISFFTFQQVAYLVDSYEGKIERINPLEYALFVSFFPQLIAGPIVHHAELTPQLRELRPAKFGTTALGFALFATGLCKKIVLADNLAPIANRVFEWAEEGRKLGLLQSWTGATAYSLQIYFDFAGYSEMALGLGLIFRICLPVNFFSPYKSYSIIEFWRRWHITLSRFLRDYLYIPLGGNRHGKSARYRNLMLTMLLGGLWHGAGWTFVLWGAAHGAMLAANHGWHRIRGHPRRPPPVYWAWVSRLATFACVTMAWVLFRSPSMEVAGRLLGAMLGLNGEGKFPIKAKNELEWILFFGCLLMVHFAPNALQILTGFAPPREPELTPARLKFPWFRPNWAWGLCVGLLLAAAIWLAPDVSEFIYFQF